MISRYLFLDRRVIRLICDYGDRERDGIMARTDQLTKNFQSSSKQRGTR